ncbi:MAG: glycosyltransferase family 39 protein, partial [Candidatus Woesearchaeota archaeon]
MQNNISKKARRTTAMEKKLLVIVLAVGIILRLLTLNNALSFDEFTQTRAVIDANPAGLDKYTEMNPLTTWTRIAFTSLLGIHVWTLRLTSLVFAILTLVVLYFLARELYGKRIAFWSVGLLALSSLHALVSTSVSFDGAFLTFYTLLVWYCFVRYCKKNEFKWLVLAGISFGLVVLTKYTGFLAMIAVAFYSLIQYRNVWRTFKECFWISLFGLVVFSVFPLAAFLTDPSYFWITLKHGTYYFGGREINILLLLMQYVLGFFWIGPLLLFGYLLGLRKPERQDWISHSM